MAVHGLFLASRLALSVACIAFLAGLAGCEQTIPAATTAEPAAQRASAEQHAPPEQERGFVRRTFTDKDGNSYKYMLFVPYNYTRGSKPPVLMFLNGLGENGDDGIRQISNNFGIQTWESREFFPFIAIAPQCRKEGAWTTGSADVEWAMQILDSVIREFDADADRVYLTGVSSGGGGVWNVGRD